MNYDRYVLVSPVQDEPELAGRKGRGRSTSYVLGERK